MRHYTVTYNTTTGKIVGYSNKAAPPQNNSAPAGCAQLSFNEDVNPDFDTQSIDLTTLLVVDIAIDDPPHDKLADWGSIKSFRFRFENDHLATLHGPLNVDHLSLERLDYAVAHFLFLPTVENGKLDWKMADNTIVSLTQLQLTNMRDEAKKDKANRTALLYKKAEDLRVLDPAPTIVFISDINNWIT